MWLLLLDGKAIARLLTNVAPRRACLLVHANKLHYFLNAVKCAVFGSQLFFRSSLSAASPGLQVTFGLEGSKLHVFIMEDPPKPFYPGQARR